eukprot:CAMPEP_0177702356 /NCGR_PEP_ID=MMETSP0484_2-20121128/7092_1 /TAXON_ID=354590 /ORGANISM="Rhodomonas lens, Strain RHODO" /LENGTH=274 /DNA_ID=CAMNT_0019213633 /DNA_START=156 /DNA_END=976 /DNA_ORIENTATION=-
MEDEVEELPEAHRTHAQILEENCDVPAYADPLFLKTGASFCVYFVGCVWILLGLRVVSERYFAQTINGIIAKYKVPRNIAGATLMAAGTSAPELIASLVSVFLSSKVETGAGTVIGSVIFNQLVVVGLCIVVSPNGMLVCSPIDMLRDLVFYMISIGVFVWFFWDDQVTLWEAWGFVGSYIFYVLVCGKWSHIDSRIRWALGDQGANDASDEGYFDKHPEPQKQSSVPATERPASPGVMPTPQNPEGTDGSDGTAIQLPTTQLEKKPEPAVTAP